MGLLFVSNSHNRNGVHAPVFYFSRFSPAPLGRRRMIRKWKRRPESADGSWTETTSRMLQQRDGGKEKKIQLSPQLNCS